MPSRNLGFAVKVVGEPVLSSHDTRRWQSKPHLSVSLERLRRILTYLARVQIGMYYATSKLYDATREAFDAAVPELDREDDFLDAFKRLGCWTRGRTSGPIPRRAESRDSGRSASLVLRGADRPGMATMRGADWRRELPAQRGWCRDTVDTLGRDRAGCQLLHVGGHRFGGGVGRRVPG